MVSQKSLTGHAKGGAAVFQMMGLCQILRDGVIPPNRSLDCVDDELAGSAHFVWVRDTLRLGGKFPLKAGMLTSLGFGHVSGLVALVHPQAFIASRTTSPGFAGTTTSCVRAGDRRPTPRSAMPWASPPSTRWPTSCCSSASYRPPATGHPTSTSTSSRISAKRSSSTSTTNTAATTPPRSPTSSPTGGAARCVTWPAPWASRRASRTRGASRSATGPGRPTTLTASPSR
ncbi:hypothetical protein BVW01_22215 [Mycobacterium tuberculosis]|nr:hypothetical protein BVW01_22215 [Mycobacterium tuberculosis]